MFNRKNIALFCLLAQLGPLPTLAFSQTDLGVGANEGLTELILVATSHDKDVKDTGAASSKTPSQQAPADGEKPITSGSDFKTGPVTDDAKLIRPVTTDSKADDKGDKKDADKGTPDGDAGKNKTGNKKAKNKKKDKHVDGKPDADKQADDDTAKSGSPTSNSVPGDSSSNPQLKKNVDVNIGSKGPISVGALRVAQLMEITPTIDRYNELRRDGLYVPGETAKTIEVLAVRQDLDEAIISAFLQSRRVVSELDRQIAAYDAVARVLEEKRDDAIRYNNILNFTSGGALAMAGGGMSIGTPIPFQNTGNELAAIAGGLSALISSYALKIQKGGKKDAEVEPNMLAPVFGLTPAEPNKYPPMIWAYLNDYEPGQKLSRRQQLIDKWVRLEYIEALTKASSAKHLKQLSGTIALHKEVTIDLLRDRIPMLEDVRATIAGMNEFLDEILTVARKR